MKNPTTITISCSVGVVGYHVRLLNAATEEELLNGDIGGPFTAGEIVVHPIAGLAQSAPRTEGINLVYEVVADSGVGLSNPVRSEPFQYGPPAPLVSLS